LAGHIRQKYDFTAQSSIYGDIFDTFVNYVPQVTIGHLNGFAFSQDKGPTFQRVKVSRCIFYWELLQ